MSLQPRPEDDTKYVVEFELTTHSGDSPVIGNPEYDQLYDLVYGGVEMKSVIMYLGGYFMAPKRESSVPAGVLAIPTTKCPKLGIDPDDLPKPADVAVLSEDMAKSLCMDQ